MTRKYMPSGSNDFLKIKYEVIYGDLSDEEVSNENSHNIRVNVGFIGFNIEQVRLSNLFITINNVLPVSLDSFDSYGEKTLENIWSFDEVLNLETSLLFIIIILSQLPILIVSNLGTEKIVNKLPQFWKVLSFLIFLIAGFLTPTIDGYTQLSFSASAIFLYLIIINIIQKRINIKFNGTSSLGF
jgi:hypothetical protein